MSIGGNYLLFPVTHLPIGRACPSFLRHLSHGVRWCHARVVMCAGLAVGRVHVVIILGPDH